MDKAKRWGVQKCEGTMICFQEWLVTAHDQGIDNNPLQSNQPLTYFSGSDISTDIYTVQILTYFYKHSPNSLKKDPY